MKNLQLKPLAMWGGHGEGRGGSKKSKPITVPPCGAGLKSCPIPASPPLQSGENLRGVGNPCGAKWGGVG